MGEDCHGKFLFPEPIRACELQICFQLKKRGFGIISSPFVWLIGQNHNILALFRPESGGELVIAANSPESPNPPGPGSRRAKWVPILGFLVLLWIVWRIVGGKSFDFKAFGSALAAMDPVWLSAAIVVVAFTYAVRALRWLTMIRPVAPSARFWPIFDATIIGFCGAVLLGRAGEFIRPYLIAKQENVSFTSQVAIWFLERLTDLLAVLVIFGWAISSIDPAVSSRVGPEIGWVLQFGGRASLAVGVVSLLILLAFRYFPNLASTRITDAAAVLPEAIRGRIQGLVAAFSAGMDATRDARVLALLLFYSLAEWILIAVCYYCILQSFAPTAALSIRDGLIILGLVSFGSVVQIPGVGGGMQIIGILVLTQMFGLGVEDATAVATMLWGIGLAICVPPGLILAARRGLSWTKLSAIQERPA